jgi:hypothetical protein
MTRQDFKECRNTFGFKTTGRVRPEIGSTKNYERSAALPETAAQLLIAYLPSA